MAATTTPTPPLTPHHHPTLSRSSALGSPPVSGGVPKGWGGNQTGQPQGFAPTNLNTAGRKTLPYKTHHLFTNFYTMFKTILIVLVAIATLLTGCNGLCTATAPPAQTEQNEQFTKAADTTVAAVQTAAPMPNICYTNAELTKTVPMTRPPLVCIGTYQRPKDVIMPRQADINTEDKPPANNRV